MVGLGFYYMYYKWHIDNDKNWTSIAEQMYRLYAVTLLIFYAPVLFFDASLKV